MSYNGAASVCNAIAIWIAGTRSWAQRILPDSVLFPENLIYVKRVVSGKRGCGRLGDFSDMPEQARYFQVVGRALYHFCNQKLYVQ